MENLGCSWVSSGVSQVRHFQEVMDGLFDGICNPVRICVSLMSSIKESYLLLSQTPIDQRQWNKVHQVCLFPDQPVVVIGHVYRISENCACAIWETFD